MSLNLKTKKQLIEVITELKAEIRQLRSEITEIPEDDYPYSGFLLHRDDDGYQLMDVDFDTESGKAKIKSSKLLHANDRDIALYHAKERLIKEMFNM